MTWDLFDSCFKWESLEHFEGRLDVSSHYSRSLILRLWSVDQQHCHRLKLVRNADSRAPPQTS